MTDDPFKSRWPDSSFRKRMHETWGRLSQDDLAQENVDREFVIGKVQEYYGYDKEQADEAVRDFERSL